MPARTRATVRNRRPVRTGSPHAPVSGPAPDDRLVVPARGPERSAGSGPAAGRASWRWCCSSSSRVTALAVLLPRPVPPIVTSAMPGSFTGYAFDTCEAPSQRQMDAWREHSPYAAVGIYIAGENRGCSRQRHLDAAWVATQAARGWRLLPLSVGPQAPCSEDTQWSKVDPSPTARYAAARGQGREVATDAGPAAAARDLGIARGSTLWLDVESFDISRTRCRDATLAYVSSWTRALRTTSCSGWASTPAPPPASGCSTRHARRHPGRTTCRNRSGWATGTSGTTPGRCMWPATGGRAGGSTSTAAAIRRRTAASP